MGGNNNFFENFERNKYLKKLTSMQRVRTGRQTFDNEGSQTLASGHHEQPLEGFPLANETVYNVQGQGLIHVLTHGKA